MSLFNKYKQQMAEHAAKVQAILDLSQTEARELTADEESEIENAHNAIKELEPKAQRMAEVEAKTEAILATAGYQPTREINVSKRNFAVPKTQKTKHFKTSEDAYAAGQWAAAALFGNKKSAEWCRENGVILAAASEGINTAGGYLVPDVLENSIIDLKESRGVARQNAYVYPMSSNATSVPRRNSGFTVYYPGEGTAITTSDMAFSQVKLQARKAGILTAMSNEVNEDSIISLADLFVNEMAYAFANAEDEAVFNGDGSSAYGGIVGLKNSLLAGSVVTAAAGDDTFAELELGFFEEAVGKCADYSGLMPKWYVSKTLFFTAMARLANAAGGTTKGDIAGGMQQQFMGYDVVFTNVLPKVTTTLASTIVGFFGDLAMCGTMGSRRGITVGTDSSKYFAEDQLAIRATQRWDWNGHETGTATVAGPMIALKMGTA